MERIKITIASSGPDGNIYSILGKVRAEMRKRRLIQKYNDLYFDVTNCNSYQEAIARIRQDVDLVDTDKII
jgi:hypothetical protein